jgi:replicative DNA helicase
MATDGEALPPHNEEAERELLGALLAYYTPDLLAKVEAEIRQDDDFYSRSHLIVWRAICAVSRGGHVDATTVAYFLSGQRDAAGRSYLDSCGGGSRLALLVSHAVPYGIVDRARIVAKDGEWRRRLVRARRQEEACLARDDAAWQAATGDTPRLRAVA